MKHNTLEVHRGYGWKDQHLTEYMQPDSLLRIASISKPITAAAIRKLEDAGVLAYTTRIVELLELTPRAGDSPDPRIYDVTIQHLLDHQGGWDRGQAFDPMFRSNIIADSLGLDRPPETEEIAQYMMGQPLQFTPGSKRSYSNFGYALLGLAIKKVTGTDYTSYVKTEILSPIGASDVHLGKTLPAKRPASESWYFDPYTCENVMKPGPSEYVPCPDGGFYLEAMDAHGGLIASSRALVKFADAFWMNGDPRPSGATNRWYYFYGSLNGNYSMLYQHTSGINIAVLFNQRRENHGDPSGYPEIRQAVDVVLNQLGY